MAPPSMSDYWDRRATEDPFFYVDNREPFRAADRERFWRRGEAGLEAMLSALGVAIGAGDEVVEIGCGVGRMTRALAARAASVRAVDVSAAMLERARELNPDLANVTWMLGDGRSLAPIEDGSADACHSHVVFQHLPDPELTLSYVAEMGRVLRPGGWAGFGVSNDPQVHRRPGIGRRLRMAALASLGRAPRGQAHPAWVGSAVDLDRLRSVADAAGMATERVVGAGTQFCLVLLRRRGG